MKRILLIVIALMLMQSGLEAQPVKGIIYADTAGVQVVKVWGTHQERGYALGYLTGGKITDVIVNYMKPEFGAFYNMARNIVIQGNDLEIDPLYKTEAQAIIDGRPYKTTEDVMKVKGIKEGTYGKIKDLITVN